MDVPSEYRATKASQKRRPKSQKMGQPPQQMQPQQQPYYNDFDMQNQQQQNYMQHFGQPDMFYGGYNPSFAGASGPEQLAQQYLNDPMANMAMQYGSSLAGQGKDIVNKNLEKVMSSSKVKYYFAVDTAYVGKKLGLLFFPFTHSDWSIRYNQDEPVAPRYEINAPDLYIPCMAFVTYILVAGMVLGTQDRFTPEQLGTQASSALVWLIIELLAFSLSLYVMNLKSGIKYLDIIAYCGYKFVGMTVSLLAGVMSSKTVYYCVLLWFCISLVFFLMRTLRVQIVPQEVDDGHTRGTKRSLYFLLTVSLAQPLLMWWLSSSIMIYRKL
ncbi:protein yif1b [Plakobranchus ocellatus]|uniref:Protein YIF1 n=1 Tax=Plakobranchus ocellatus TaxID=259542 RepID=A0AAV3ZYD3_9GAST|nr:protein yif1b [Plakobranchus ocellatus]